MLSISHRLRLESRTIHRFRAGTLALIALGASSAFVRADTVFTKTSKTEGRVLQVSAATDELMIQNASGTSVSRKLSEVTKIKVDSENAFSDAEEAFEQEKWEAAATGYDKALASTKVDWIKDRSVLRVVTAAANTKQFSLMAGAWAQLASRIPVGAEDKKPAISTDKAQVAKAIPLVERVNAAKQSDLVRQFLAQLYIAAERYDDVNRLFPPGSAKDPSILVLQAMVACKKGNFAVAIQSIEANRPVISQPDQQFDALFTLAEARQGIAGTEPVKLQEAAIAYMRVVAHFGSKNDPRVPLSMHRAAEILEKLGQPAEAAGLYNQISTDERDKTLAAEAKKKAEQLKNAKPATK